MSLCTLLISNSGYQHSRQRELATVEALLVKYVHRIFFISLVHVLTAHCRWWVGLYTAVAQKNAPVRKVISWQEDGGKLSLASGSCTLYTLIRVQSFVTIYALPVHFRHAGVCLVLPLLWLYAYLHCQVPISGHRRVMMDLKSNQLRPSCHIKLLEFFRVKFKSFVGVKFK